MKLIDARGLSCPQPVVLVQQAIKGGETNFEILLNSETSCENVSRLLVKNKFSFEVNKLDDDIKLVVSK